MTVWERQREAQDARERLELIADEKRSAEQNAAAGRRCVVDTGCGGIILV